MMNRLAFALPTFFVANLALANGLEAPTTASARSAAIGGASASSAEGPDALLLNPAGLARAKSFQITVNAMPVMNRTSAPLMGPNSSTRAQTGLAPLGELLASFEVMPGLGVGAGANFAGGLGANFGAVEFGGYAMSPEVSQMLGAVEASIGAGYQLTKSFSIGAAWRVSYMRGEFKQAGLLPNGMLQALSIDGASGTAYDGFRFGAQYRSEDNRFGFGASVRTPVEWKLTGAATMVLATPEGAAPAMPLGDVTMKLVFPLQAAIGGDVAVTDAFRMFAQYSYSNYSVNEMQEMQMGGMTLQAKLSWSDRHTAQVGGELALGETWSVRAGYIFESRVVPEDRPSLYTPPGVAHSIALGAGSAFGEHLRVDFAAVYSTSTGDGAPAVDQPAFAGEYTVDNLVGSVSASYQF